MGCFAVAPYAGAWIEIPIATYLSMASPVAPDAGAWIDIVLFPDVRDMGRGRSLRGSVDLNLWWGVRIAFRSSRSLRGSVD